jgi:muramoyltetrapeptide carboxypeptidase LdcA involved in peptidoglycan recycling
MEKPFTKLAPLAKGDRVAIISPSAGVAHIFPWVYYQGIERLKEVFNLDPVEFPSALRSPDYLSENPKARADDINNAFADKTIKAIIATIGGNDQIRLLPFLDEKIISSNPKPFMGYSDNTNLHLFLWNLGIRSLYGGAIMTQFASGSGMHPYTVDMIKKALFSPEIGEITASPERSDVDLDWANKENLTKLRPFYKSSPYVFYNCPSTIIKGRLWGGCLEVLDFHLSIKKHLPSPEKLKGTILFIETSEEMPSAGFVYRFIAALAELNFLQKFQAILVAYPKAQFLGKEPPEGKEAFIANQQKAIKNALNDYQINIPIIFNMNFGHTDPQMIIPSGGLVKIDGVNRRVFFD